MILKLVIVSLFTAFTLVFTWPWIDAYLLRHDSASRILDRMLEEWDRESDDIPPRFDGRPW